MRLPDHPDRAVLVQPVLVGAGGVEDLLKLRANVLKHVLGFGYSTRCWKNERWSHLFDVPLGLRLAAERALRALALVAPDGSVAYEDLVDAVVHDPSVRALADELVPAYRRVIAETIDRWRIDFHWPAHGRFQLIDSRAVVIAGKEGNGWVWTRTCYRWAHRHQRCDDLSGPDRARRVCWQAQADERGAPVRHVRGRP